ncbi:2S seed storage albumin protein-like [Mercurialis annua]|uniref:2S seed storage albumin protein-like n=1 Tax=Mercurialis annua TaxID=3986 RepID=UPI002160CE6D|nr:2S seed storage albumin protein-like [Mercurialis annua]
MATFIPTVAIISVFLIITAYASSSANMSEQCRGIEQSEYNLRDCMMYMIGNGCPCERQPMSEIKMKLFAINLQLQCCSLIRQVPEECQCEALEGMAGGLRQRGIIQKEDYEGVMQRGNEISSFCGLPQSCNVKLI